MRLITVKFANSQYDFVTRINGTIKQIKEYYIGQRFNMTLDGVTDNVQTCINIEFKRLVKNEHE